MTPLALPSTLPEFARGYLRLLDEAVTKTVHDACVSAESHRNAAELFNRIGKAWEATGANETADRIDLDPRLHVADVMHAGTKDGTAKLMLHTYISLLEEQVLARRQRSAA